MNYTTKKEFVTQKIDQASPIVFQQDNKVMASSRDVAEYFGKLHKNVLRDIEQLECSEEFNQHNFVRVEYLDAKGERRSGFHMTKDGFVFLAMGFTGKRAAQFKEAYIAQFNAMETALREQIVGPDQKNMSRREILQMALAAEEENEALMFRSQALEESIVKTERRLKRIELSDGKFNITTAAKVLQVRPGDLFDYLQYKRWIYKRPGGKNWLGYTDKTQSGLLLHKVTTVQTGNGDEKIIEQCLVTPKGLVKIATMLGQEKEHKIVKNQMFDTEYVQGLAHGEVGHA